MHKTEHKLSDGTPVTFTGSGLYNITATTDDGQTASAVVAADDEWKTRTRLMAIQTTMRLRGQSVEYVVSQVSA